MRMLFRNRGKVSGKWEMRQQVSCDTYYSYDRDYNRVFSAHYRPWNIHNPHQTIDAI